MIYMKKFKKFVYSTIFKFDSIEIIKTALEDYIESYFDTIKKFACSNDTLLYSINEINKLKAIIKFKLNLLFAYKDTKTKEHSIFKLQNFQLDISNIIDMMLIDGFYLIDDQSPAIIRREFEMQKTNQNDKIMKTFDMIDALVLNININLNKMNEYDVKIFEAENELKRLKACV